MIKYIYAGALIDAFDFCIYMVFSKQLSSLLTGKENSIIAILLFSISYTARPIGAWFFGRSESEGKVISFLRNSPIFIAIPTIIIAFIPSNSSIIFSYLFLICRFLQGFIFGGESGVSFVYIKNLLKNNINSILSLFLTSGALSIALCFIILPRINSVFGIEPWRIAFIFSGIISLVFFFIRRRINVVKLSEINVKKSSLQTKNIVLSILSMLPYAILFNMSIAYIMTIGKRTIPYYMLTLILLSFIFGAIIDKSIKLNSSIYTTVISYSYLFISILLFFILKNNVSFIFSFIGCCFFGGLSINLAINHTNKNSKKYQSFGITYNLLMGFLGALIPFFAMGYIS